MSNKFAHCHPDFDQNLMWCMHHNGSWIAFPLYDEDGQGHNLDEDKDESAPSSDEETDS